jgi:hypothetical protein
MKMFARSQFLINSLSTRPETNHAAGLPDRHCCLATRLLYAFHVSNVKNASSKRCTVFNNEIIHFSPPHEEEKRQKDRWTNGPSLNFRYERGLYRGWRNGNAFHVAIRSKEVLILQFHSTHETLRAAAMHDITAAQVRGLALADRTQCQLQHLKQEQYKSSS